MSALRRLGWLALVLAFGQIVFGAIVRVTGSGMGCGDSWPQCAGEWLPPLERPDLIIEVTHRYIAAALSVAIFVLTAAASVRRRAAGVGGRGGVLRATLLAAALVVAAALFGAVTVKLELANKGVIVTHLAIAMTLLAVLLVVIARSQGRATTAIGVSTRTVRTAYSAVVLVFLALVLGALVAHIPGANTACAGFPLCDGARIPSMPAQRLQYAHRVVALLLLLHAAALAWRVSRRNETQVIGLARLTFVAVTSQVAIAGFLVELNLPPVLRSLHAAVGTLIWLLVVTLVLVARRHAPARAAERRGLAAPTVAEAGA